MLKKWLLGVKSNEDTGRDTHQEPAQLIFDRKTLQILQANQAAIDLYGYSLEEFRVLTIREIRPVWEQAKLARHLQHQKMNGSNSGIWKHLKKSGDVMLVQVDAEDVVFNGQTERRVTIKDITPSVKAGLYQF